MVPIRLVRCDDLRLDARGWEVEKAAEKVAEEHRRSTSGSWVGQSVLWATMTLWNSSLRLLRLEISEESRKRFPK